jgi:hypothetical protein
MRFYMKKLLALLPLGVLAAFAMTAPQPAAANVGVLATPCYECTIPEPPDLETECELQSGSNGHVDCADNESKTWCSVAAYQECVVFFADVSADGSVISGPTGAAEENRDADGVITSGCGLVISRRYTPERAAEIEATTALITL